MRPEPAAIVFDFDGVILESADIKSRAFVETFSEFPEHSADILAHHLANAGVPRYDKFRHIYGKILRRPLTDRIMNDMDRRFSGIVRAAIDACPYVPGIVEFIERRYREIPLYVASGTPDAELSGIVARRGLGRYFRLVCGSPRRKTELLAGILSAAGCPASRALMIGDGVEDRRAAARVGTCFLGRWSGTGDNPFAGLGVTVFEDFVTLESDWAAMELESCSAVAI